MTTGDSIAQSAEGLPWMAGHNSDVGPEAVWPSGSAFPAGQRSIPLPTAPSGLSAFNLWVATSTLFPTGDFGVAEFEDEIPAPSP